METFFDFPDHFRHWWFTCIHTPRGLWLSINNFGENAMPSKGKGWRDRGQSSGTIPLDRHLSFAPPWQRQVSSSGMVCISVIGYLFVDFEIWFYGFSFRLTLRWFSIALDPLSSLSPCNLPGSLASTSLFFFNNKCSELAGTSLQLRCQYAVCLSFSLQSLFALGFSLSLSLYIYVYLALSLLSLSLSRIYAGLWSTLKLIFAFVARCY